MSQQSTENVAAFYESAVPCFAGCEVSIRLIPMGTCEQGGDWCEAFQVSDDAIAFSIGDVSGHGDVVHERAETLRACIKRAAASGDDAAHVLARANRALLDSVPQRTATAQVGLFNRTERLLQFASAGHPPPLTVGPQGASFYEFSDAALPLGICERLMPKIHRLHLRPSTLLVFYTDGVIERDRKPLQGMTQLLNAATFAYNFSRFPTASVIERQMLLTGNNPDDVAILAAWSPPDQPAGR